MTKFNTSPRPPIARWFLSDNEPRLRAGWRLLAHTLLIVFFLMLFGVILSLGLLFSGLPLETLLDERSALLDGLLSLPTITVATYVARKIVDRRSFASLGFTLDRSTLRDLLAGILISAFMMGFIFIIEVLLGWVKIDGFAWDLEPQRWGIVLLEGFVIFVIVGFQEELLSRGYHLQNLVDGLNLPAGVLISSSVFALLHFANPSASISSTILLFFAGVFLAFGWVRTGALWLSIGLHIGWNFFEGNVFGFPVSGITTRSLILHTSSGPKLLTGAAFGPEAGLILLPALGMGIALVWAYTEFSRRRDSGGSSRNNSDLTPD